MHPSSGNPNTSQTFQVLSLPTPPNQLARAGEEDLTLRGRLQPWGRPRGCGCGAAAGGVVVAGWLLHRG